MTREEKRKAIDTLEKSVPVIAMTQEEFNDYIQTVNQIMGWLEQEPCEDCISRQAVLDITWEEPSYTDAMNVLTEVRDKVKELPSFNPKQKWIPVSKRLPGDGKYLVTRGDVIGRPMIGMRYFSKDLSKVDEYEFESKKGVSGWCEYDSEYGWYIDDKVTAWMPLPEPMRMEKQ